METICCVCNRKKSPRGWIKQFPDRNKTQSHGYCPECYSRIAAKILARIANQQEVAA